MAYRLELDEDVRNGVARCAREQLDRAVTELSERVTEDPVGAVHAARKAVKKERSLLRLVRGAMAPKQRRRENAALRAAARELSAARDAEVMIDTLSRLSERYVGQLPEGTFQEIRAQLEQARDAQRGQLVESALRARAVQELGAVRVRVEDWKLRQGGWQAVEKGLSRSYRDGRSAFARARSRRSTAALHAWRKRTKDLWYQERLLGEICGPAVAGQAKDAHHLADLLGDDHDLGGLRDTLTRGAVHAAADLDAVVRLIDHRRRQLQTEAFYLGDRVYAEKPKAFVRRMQRSWTAGRGRAAAERDQHPGELAEATRAAHPA
ncbi:MAG TPA: CHAD domain-containing protein [Solirubrobacteraceae bacterium]|nr:CHAD domain-containing protein [Solirubrobacteraceae bacterium]